MTVERFQTILEQLDPQAELLIEYSPRRHEYVRELLIGVRMEDDDTVTLFGITEAL